MSTFSKIALSGSTNGKGIKVAATADPGTTIHTAVSGTAAWDEVWLYAYNSDTAPVTLTIEYGGNTDPDNLISVTLESKSGLVPILPGTILQNSLVIKAYAASADKITLTGWVNRIS